MSTKKTTVKKPTAPKNAGSGFGPVGTVTPFGVVGQVNPPAPAPAPVPVVQKPTDPVAVLYDALKSEGIAPSQVDLKYRVQTVMYPGGFYELRQVQVAFPNGRTTFLDADGVLANPSVAVLDVKWIMTHPFLS